ncbi:MAG TPA: hypothetical protein VM010_03165, partial [Chitinophagaceae bacterium]|nr:hypothetical protein [Chitinophagaceae bacterium]
MGRLYWCCAGWLLLFILSCSSTAPSLFSKQSGYAQYGKKLTDAGLIETALGRQWFAAGKAALQQPVTITIPYKEHGYFAAEKPRAVGLKFTATRGEKV